MRIRIRTVILVLLALVVSGMTVRDRQADATSTADISYVYDELGRLVAVVDPSQGTAIYSYDAVGNLTSIVRQSASIVSILEFTPNSGAVGSQVTLYGTGFSATPSENTVQFNGTQATVVSASTTKIVATVPAGATSGAISVTTPTGTATSGGSFVVGPAGPSVTGLIPLVAAPGDSVTISGTGFDPTFANNRVKLNINQAAVTSANSTSVVFTVPPLTGSGPVTLFTPLGTASGGDLFVPPSPYLPADVGGTGRAVFGTPKTVTTSSANQVGLLVFDGIAGNRVSLIGTSSSYPRCEYVSIKDPAGVTIAGPLCMGANSFMDVVTLPSGGTYTILVDPRGADTGSITIQLYDVPPDPTGPITIGGSASVTTTVPGQDATLTFSATAGQRVSLIGTSSSYPRCEYVSIKDPAGVTVRSPLCMGANSFMDVVSLLSSGLYTILVDPRFEDTGSLTIQLYDVPPDPTGPITIGGSASVTTTVPGQDATLTFSATAGQTVSLAVTSSSYPRCEYISIKNPSGGNVAGPSCGGPLNNASLVTTGTYTILVDPRFEDTGNMTLALSDASGGMAPQAETQPDASPQKTQDEDTSSRPTPSPTPSPMPAPTPSPMPTPTPSPAPSGSSPSPGVMTVQAGSIEPSSGGQTPSSQPEDDETLTTGPGGPEAWAPDPQHLNNWYSGRPDSALTQLPPLVADPGVTAVAGQVLTLNGSPLHDVTLGIDGRSTTSDGTGRFLISDLSEGHHELMIDGSSASNPGQSYGIFCWGMDVVAGRTNVLPFTIWMPKLDTDNVVQIPSPTNPEVVVTTPTIPGLEVRIPAGTVIIDEEGEGVTEVGITPIPIDRTPFPLPSGIEVPIYFTIQPGGAYLSQKAQIIYPNYMGRSPGTRIDFWHYDPEDEGWYVYGKGTVTADGEQVVPDPGVGIYEFSGAMINSGRVPPDKGPNDGNEDGDPVNLGTGLFVHEDTDLILPDVLPISLTRTYRQGDSNARAFGIGMTHDFEIFLWSANEFLEADLILPDGGRVHYVRSDNCNPCGFLGAKFESVGRPGPFYKSKLEWNGSGWDLTRKDGLVYVFADSSPLQSIRDRYGNTITITREGGANGNITQIRSPNGRWLQFTYVSGTGRVSQVTDNIGRTVSYTYDAQNRLWKVTDANGKITEYGYDGTSERLKTIKDPRLITFLTNEYDANGRIFKQTQADGTFYLFTYTVDGSGNVTQTDVSDPRAFIRRVTFNANGFSTSDTRAVGQPAQQQISYEREAGTNLVLSTTDALGRKTRYTYDPAGNAQTITRLANTPDAVTTAITYEPAFNQIETITDPLGHATRFIYTQGKLITIRDPLLHDTTMTYNTAGQVTSVTDALQNKTEFGYELGDPFSVKDPLGNTATRFVDAAGRIASQTDPTGGRTLNEYDKLNQLLKTTDPLGGLTQFTYDENGNPRTIKDARNNTTTFTPNSMDWTASRKDPLTRTESYVYDGLGNLTKHTDRKAQITTYTYDPLNRLTFVGFGTRVVGGITTYASTITYTYDAGNRVRTAVDSIAGTYTLGYDDLDRLTSEASPQGSVSYTYDDADRRQTMTVAGQPQTSFSYDDADRPTQITRDTQQVGYSYDNADRPTQLSLPGGITQTYTYDTASQLTGILYKAGAATLGDLTYSYDAAGRRTTQGGSYARTGLPTAVSSFVHNANNQMTNRAGITLTYDKNGNLLSDGTYTYTWDTRDHLTTLKQGTATLATYRYDPFNRRQRKTASGVTTDYLYDGANPIQEKVGGTPSANLVSGLSIDQHHTRTDSAGQRSVLTDALGSTIALADNNGALQTNYTYEPFGKTSVGGASNSSTYQYTGREADAAGLDYYRARFYSPTLQRFISEDPIGFAAGDPNLYAYVGNSPTNYRDPLGLKPPWDQLRWIGRQVRKGAQWLGDLIVTSGRKAFIDILDIFRGKPLSERLYDNNLNRILNSPKRDVKQFRDAVKECARRLGIIIDDDMEADLHDAWDEEKLGQDGSYQEIVEFCLEYFGQR